jgi:hypothetical protein
MMNIEKLVPCNTNETWPIKVKEKSVPE